MSWMVTGGAGYIGAHVVRAFQEVGLDVVVVDDLSSGHREFVRPEVPFVEGTIVDTELMTRTMEEHDVEGVVHLAGFKYAGVSVDRPLHTYTQNVTGTVNLLEAMERTGVRHMVFSSSAATFGTPDSRAGHRGDADAPRVAVRREQADRRVGDPRPGPRHRAPAHLAALLQRRRLGQRRPLRHQPAQPVPDRLRDAARREDAPDQRGRLRHPRRHLRARLRARRRPRGLARRGGPAPRGR